MSDWFIKRWLFLYKKVFVRFLYFIQNYAFLGKNRNKLCCFYISLTCFWNPVKADKATGSDKRNRHLSIERAKYIGKKLIKRGISKDSMKVTSLGGINQFSPKEANRFSVILLTP